MSDFPGGETPQDGAAPPRLRAIEAAAAV